MTEAPHRPRGRRPGNEDTQGTIRETAARMFHAEGYDKVSLRAIAREADVDPALVHHYFSSKADLYCAAVFGTRWAVEDRIEKVLAGDRESVGRRAAKTFFEHWDEEERFNEFLGTLSGEAEQGSQVLTEMLAREVFTPIAAHFGHSNAPLRGQLVTAALVGMLVARHQLGLPLLAAASPRQLASPVGAMLQHYLVDTW